METLRKAAEGFVQDMRPKGETCHAALSDWLASFSDRSDAGRCLELANDVHKFAGSAGQVGFPRLSAAAILLEVALRAVANANEVDPLDCDLLACLVEDFGGEVQGMDPAESELVTGQEVPFFTPFPMPPQILLAGLPGATERVLIYVIEHMLGFAWPAPSIDALDQVPKGREPDLAIVPHNLVVSDGGADYSARYCFPVYVFRPVGSRGIVAALAEALQQDRV